MAIKTIICLSFIVLNNFFANMSVKKNCASPTKSLTARHWLTVTSMLQLNCNVLTMMQYVHCLHNVRNQSIAFVDK